jgi:serine phosphatase RsbU (regulator of sigma subunit)
MVMAGALSFLAAPGLVLDGTNLRGIVMDPQKTFIPLVALFMASFAFLPLALHLALVFPHDRKILRTSPHVLGWVYGVPVFAVLVLITATALQGVASFSKSALARTDFLIDAGSAVLALAGGLVAWRVARTGRAEGWRAFWNRPIASLFTVLGFLLGATRILNAVGFKYVAVGFGIFTAVVPILATATFPVLACIALYRSYREAGPEERRQVKWPLWGTFIAIATKIITVIVAQAGSFWMYATGAGAGAIHALTIIEFLPIFAYLLIPISFAFAILKYRLMNIDIIIRKTVAYAFLTGAILVMYLALVGGLGTLLVRLTGVRNQTMVIASTLVVALVFVPLRNKLQTLVDRNLFRHKYDYPEALRAIAAETLTANDLATFLASAAEKIQQALQNRAVVIFVTRHDEMVAAAKVGLADSVLGTMRMQRASLLQMLDRPFDPTRHQLPDDAAAAVRRIEAVLMVPINTPGTPPNGFIALAAKLTNAPFDVEDIDFLRSVADQLDIGIDRIRQQREEVDYEQARTIQQSLLPREMPHLAGVELSGMWQPARTMGGDYYDVLKLGESELALCIGDVAGKGMPAALLMSGLQAAVRASASGSPRDLCERVRRVVVSSLSGGRFVTFFYATIDTDAKRLRWCNAGHNASILARADGSVVRLSDGGPAFSRLFRDDPYSENEIAIEPGDRLVLFTDGVSEASGGDGEMFGETRLEQLVVANRSLHATELQQTLAGAATAFSGGELDDDLTLVVAALTPRA